LNFELNLLIFGSDVAMQAKDFFMKDLSMSQPGLLTPVSFANVIGSDMQNFNATTSGLDFVTVESAATLEPGFVNFGLFMNYAVNTLPYFEKTETIQSRTKFNDTLLGADINVGYGVAKRFDLGLSLPRVRVSSAATASVGLRIAFPHNGDSWNHLPFRSSLLPTFSRWPDSSCSVLP
jgi:hypothetical protein